MSASPRSGPRSWAPATRSSSGTARSGPCAEPSVGELVLLHAEVVPDLVEDGAPHLGDELAVAVRGSLVGPLVQGDALWHPLAGMHRGGAFVQSHQTASRALLDDEHGVFEVGQEHLRDGVDRRLHGLLELRHAHAHRPIVGTMLAVSEMRKVVVVGAGTM